MKHIRSRQRHRVADFWRRSLRKVQLEVHIVISRVMTFCGRRNLSNSGRNREFGVSAKLRVEAQLLDSKVAACPFWSYRSRLTFLIASENRRANSRTRARVYISHSALKSFHWWALLFESSRGNLRREVASSSSTFPRGFFDARTRDFANERNTRTFIVLQPIYRQFTSVPLPWRYLLNSRSRKGDQCAIWDLLASTSLIFKEVNCLGNSSSRWMLRAGIIRNEGHVLHDEIYLRLEGSEKAERREERK